MFTMKIFLDKRKDFLGNLKGRIFQQEQSDSACIFNDKPSVDRKFRNYYYQGKARYILALALWFCGIVIVAQNSGFVPQITLKDFAESYTRKKGGVEQLKGSVIISAW